MAIDELWDGELRLSVENTDTATDVLLQVRRNLSRSVAHAYPLEIIPDSKRILSIDRLQNQAGVFPIITYYSNKLYQKKYHSIESIWFDIDEDAEIPKTHEGAVEFLKDYLPRGFVQDPEYGMGLTKELRPIISAIEEIQNVSQIVISAHEETRYDQSIFYINNMDYYFLRSSFGRITRNHQTESLAERNLLAHNEILHKNLPQQFARKERSYVPGTIFKLVGGSKASETVLKGSDRRALIETLAGNAKAIARRDPKEFVQLQKDIELVSLDRLLAAFEAALVRNVSEAHWQSVLELNPFILSMVFGYPIVIVQSAASVGGSTVSGAGMKIADFLSENSATHNAALVEIKTAHTGLFGREYRPGVFSPSQELIGSVVQVLDQRLKLTTDIAGIKHRSKMPELQTYAVDCVILVGRTPRDEYKISSFELIRNQFKDVRIFTYDDLFGKLLLLRELLSGERYISNIESELETEPPGNVEYFVDEEDEYFGDEDGELES